MATLPRTHAEALIDEMLALAYDRDAGYPRRASLAEFSQRALRREGDQGQLRWLTDGWDSWSSEERQRYFAEKVCKCDTGIGFGEKSRELRATVVEERHPERDELTGSHGQAVRV
jgi:hypothetical protein